MKNLITNFDLLTFIISNLSKKNKINPYKLFSRLLTITGLTIVFAVSSWAASFKINDASITEGNSGTSNMSFTLTIDSTCKKNTTYSIDWATADNTATDENSDNDYSSDSGKYTYTQGKKDDTKGSCGSTTINIPIVGDFDVENDETFYINLTNAKSSNNKNPVSISDNQGVGTITNDDNANPPLPNTCTGSNGLTGNYYNNKSFTDPAVLSRIDPTISFDWGSSSPGPGVDADNFSVEWIGAIQIPESGNYIFSFLHDDSFEVWIDGVSIYQRGSWTGSFIDAPSKYFSAGCHSIKLQVVEGGGGASAWMKWRNDVSIGSSVTVPESNLWTGITPPDVDNATDLCYRTPTYEGNCTADASGFESGVGCIQTIELLNSSEDTLSDLSVGLGITSINASQYTECGIDQTSGDCTHTDWTDFGTDDTLGEGIFFSPMNALSSGENHTIYTESNQATALFQGTNLFSTYTKDGTTYKGVVNPCQLSYCKRNGLSQGFHIVDPDDGDDVNSYEIYCDNNTVLGRDLIALPIKNDYNNFVFKDDTPDANYYAAADNAKTTDANNNFAYLEIKIAGDHSISVVPESVAEGSDNEGYFSNINLIGTPFAIDWDNTVLSNCDTNKLRKGADFQAVKVNTLDYTKGRCKVDSMRLKILSDYQYLTFPSIATDHENDEILEETCRQIFERVPDAPGFLPTGSSNGYFWIDPDQGGRGTNDGLTDIFRPVVAYCKYQDDIKQAWTFVMGLDALVTNSKNDIKTMETLRDDPTVKHDTCSQLGLLFFVPNTKDTFERTRKYLYDKKNDWINYTGTIREKYKIFQNNPSQEYYIPGEGFNEIWPYGPFGLYFPQQGNRDIDGDSLSWYPGSTSTQGNMSGACMNSGAGSQAALCTDHTVTMGEMGWRTTLRDQVEDPVNPLQGISDGDQFWIADVGAGDYLTKSGTSTDGLPEYSVTGPGLGGTPSAHRTPYYEPNGNYSQYAWLNFISDSEGHVYHNDDNNAFYSYYDYLCMAWDNYRSVTRFGLTPGPFTVIDAVSGLTDGDPIVNSNIITTKIVNKPMDLQIVTLDDTLSYVSKDQNVSAGIFLNYAISNSATDSETVHDFYYFGQIGANNPDFDTNTTGVYNIKPTDWPTSEKIVPFAKKRMFFQFKFCTNDDLNWDECWTRSGNTATCTDGSEPNSLQGTCKTVESNDFAVRPKKYVYTLAADEELLRSGNYYAFENIQAVDENDAITTDYNQTKDGNIDLNSTKYLNTGVVDIEDKLNGVVDLNASNDFEFINGQSVGDINYSFNDVGAVALLLADRDWAAVDTDDTPGGCQSDTPPYGRYVCADINTTFIVDHFELLDVNLSNYDQRLTYLTYNSDLNMSAPLQVIIRAMNAQSEITQNFRQGPEYYENPVGVDVSAPLHDANGVPIGLELVEHDVSPAYLGFGGTDANGTHSISWSKDENETQKLLFNYNKELNIPLNPFNVSGPDVNLSVNSRYTSSSGLTADANGTSSSGGEATFYYAKIKSSEYFYESVITSSKTTPISINIYCDLGSIGCGLFGIDTVSGSTDETAWYLSLNHRQDRGDGDIVLKVQSAPLIEGAGSPTIDTKTNPDGASIIVLDADDGTKDANVTTGVGPSLPMTVGIEIVQNGDIFTATPPYTNGWLFHNLSDPILLPNPLYKVRFIGVDSDWTGVGKTGHAMDINISTVPTRRMDW